jgi:hypothetical protein
VDDVAKPTSCRVKESLRFQPSGQCSGAGSFK